MKVVEVEKKIVILVDGGRGPAYGENGREIELQASVTHIQWRYVGDVSWINLIALSEITGPTGANGTNGTNGTNGINGTNGSDGREIQLQKSLTHIQWKYEDELSWTNLVALTEITGPTGATGATGATGSAGANGLNGVDGLSAYEIAVENGFVGTELQWLDTLIGLQGEQGIPGNNGASAYEIAVDDGFVGTESEWLDSLAVGGAIQSVANYTALRALSDYSHNVVVVKDYTYTGPDGNTYTTIGGIFKKDSTGTENGGTIIVGTYIWKREWDGVNGLAEWWECGGYDVNGNSYSGRYVNANGIFNDGDRLNAAATIISNLQLYPNKNYTIDKTIKVKSETVTGNNATFTRVTTPSSLTTATSSIGATTATVADASLYRCGQIIVFVNTGAANGGLAFDENAGFANPLVITSINTTTNVITFSTPVDKNIGVGWKVILNIALMSLSADLPDNGAFHLKNLNFDGNRAGNNHCYDWRFAGEFLGNSNDTKVLIQNCHFKNSVVECINYGKLHVQDCSYDNLGGSFIHVSTPTYINALVVVNNTHGKLSNQIANTITGHSEATVTSSANTTHVRLTNCSFIDGGESVLSFDSYDDFELIYSNNYCKNYKYIFIGGTGAGIKVEKNIKLNNNTFDNCGPIYIAAASPSSIYKNTAITNVTINDNTFINSSMRFEHAAYINISNNFFYWDNSKSSIYDYTTNPINSAQQAMNHFINFDRLYITNNVFEYPNAHNANTQFGLLLQHNNIVRKTSAGADTEYLFSQDVKVNGNTFAGFKYAIATAFTTSPQNLNMVKQAVGWEYKNNIVYMSRNTGATNGTGIFVDPGVICEGNTIYTNNTIACYAGIIVAGVGTSGNAHNRLIGGIAINNKVLGCTGATAADIVANADGVRYNVTCINNMTRDDIYNATNGYFSGNYKLTTANYPQLSAMTCPEWRYFGENSDQY